MHVKSDFFLGLSVTAIFAVLGWVGTNLVELKTTVALMHKDNELLLKVVESNNIRVSELYAFHR
jgi:hypothetical protein|tara:strand:- start:544 stop:735 length:192 start_codon:yes stop_codon:yes gene_type:complete